MNRAPMKDTTTVADSNFSTGRRSARADLLPHQMEEFADEGHLAPGGLYNTATEERIIPRCSSLLAVRDASTAGTGFGRR